MLGHRTRLRWADLALVLVLAGAVLRVWRWAAGWPLWLDEEMVSMNLRDRGLSQLTGALDNNQSAPLGWLWLQRLLVDLFGTGERTLRLVPLLFGIGTLLVAWLFGRHYLGPVGAVALVGFCAVNDAFVRYSAEVKHYSADAFAVLVLLGLAAWVVERPTRRRAATWWAAAAAGGWISMGATLAAPGLALVLVGSAWWRRRWARARDVALPGVAWLASFAVQYQLSLRFTAGSDYLANFWDGLGYPPRSGPLAVARWLVHRPAALAADPLHLNAGLPGGVSPKILGGLFWLLVAAGLVVAVRRRPAYGLLLAAPVASALALAVLRVVPLAVRLALWMVPALLAAAAVALDAAARLLVWARRRFVAPSVPSVPAPALARTVAVAALVPLMGLVPLGTSVVESTATRPAVDDRGAVGWMRAAHRPGDLVLAVGSATRAFQWYDPDGRLRPWRMAMPTPPGSSCDPAGLVTATAGYRRVIVYSGTRAQPYKNAPQVLARRLGDIGKVVEVRRFGGGDSIVYVVERDPGPPSPSARGECIVVR
jgi:Dolichyl-phosphate-mannose-protein mannosyltransferase